MTEKKYPYHKYFRDLSKYSDSLDVNKSTSSSRFGLKRARDIFTMGRTYYGEGGYYIGMFKDFIYLAALFPLVLTQIGVSTVYSMPLVAIYLLACVMMGFLSYRVFKLARSEKEYEDKNSVSRYMNWAMLKEIQEELIRQRPKKKTGGKKK
jgi:hypothetical protein